jgi:hypothetical protein
MNLFSNRPASTFRDVFPRWTEQERALHEQRARNRILVEPAGRLLDILSRYRQVAQRHAQVHQEARRRGDRLAAWRAYKMDCLATRRVCSISACYLSPGVYPPLTDDDKPADLS